MEALVVIVGVVAALWMQSGNAERCCSDIAHVVPASKETVRVSPSKDVATRQFRRMDGRSKIDSDKGNAVPARIADSSRVFMQEELGGVSDDDAARLASEKNQEMDALLDQPQFPADYGSTMIALYRDRSQDVVTRDFAVQHIGH